MAETYFPIGGSREDFEKTGIGKIKRLSAAAQKRICGLKPYKGSNDPLWQLHQLDILDKHVVLVPVAAATVGEEFGFAVPDIGEDFTIDVTMTMGPASPTFTLKRSHK